MEKTIRNRLLSMREPEDDYQKFSKSLIPGVQEMIGIRLPRLRKLAKEIASSDWKPAMEETDLYFEEVMLRGMIISCLPGSLSGLLPLIAEFIPLVDNWSVCDSVFMGMKVFQTDRELGWEFLQKYLHSEKEFEIRVSLVILMQHFLKCDKNGRKISRKRTVSMKDLQNGCEENGLFLDRCFSALKLVRTTDYYASMMAAWMTAEAFCCFPYHTWNFLREHNLDTQTGQRAVRKICESRIPEGEVKGFVKQIL